MNNNKLLALYCFGKKNAFAIICITITIACRASISEFFTVPKMSIIYIFLNSHRQKPKTVLTCLDRAELVLENVVSLFVVMIIGRYRGLKTTRFDCVAKCVHLSLRMTRETFDRHGVREGDPLNFACLFVAIKYS